MENNKVRACPWLPSAPEEMSYRQLQRSLQESPLCFFETTQRYANYLWLRKRPARAILALCRGIYLDPDTLPSGSVQPYKAYRWMLDNYQGEGFLGNPRISFLHQAARIPAEQALKVLRAWALWYLTRHAMPELPTDPAVPENPPDLSKIAAALDKKGLPGEGRILLESLQA
jgi:hypothetical protein